MFLDFLKLEGSLEDQAKQFLIKARQDPQWVQDNLRYALTPCSKQTIAIQEQLDGKTADWIEKVSDKQYQVRREARMFLWTR
jgi:hypothetical protein